MSARRLLIIVALAGVTAAGCPTVDLGEAPPDPGVCNPDFPYYVDVIWPEFLAPADTTRSCVANSACHRISDGRSSFRIDPAGAPIDHDSNYQIVVRFLNCGSPEISPLVTKPLALTDPHGGGDIFDATSAQYAQFLDWFLQ